MGSDVITRAETTHGESSDQVYAMVAAILKRRHIGGGTLLDVGCGQGALRNHVIDCVTTYSGADLIRYDAFPTEAAFYLIDLDERRLPIGDESMDVVVAVETIEHLENPRAFMRELYRLVKPGGLIIVTTPNQLSLLSLVTLVSRGQYNHFQEAPGLYPAHITALLPVDLVRISNEIKLSQVEISFSNSGRIPLTGTVWPSFLKGRLFSDNMAVSAIK